MVERKLEYAHDVFRVIGSSAACGYNMFVNGNDMPDNSYYDLLDRLRGYELGKKMSEEGKIFFTHNFGCNCGGLAFMYGGFFVCNSCGGKNINQDWWVVKVEKDGNSFCCYGLNFEDLQSSDNYAFGDTFKETLKNYGKIFKSRS